MEIGSKEWQQLIIDGAKRFEIHIDQNTIEQFAVHAEQLLKWNRKINLTAVTNPKDVAIKHFVDSIIPSCKITPGAKILDVGSGGGFPGIPLKILMPSLSVLLIDASRKKVSFLKHVIRTLKLENIEARQLRAEDLAKQSAACNSFDIIISRALASTEKYVAMAEPLLAKDGVVIDMKGSAPLQEIAYTRSQVGDDTVFLKSNNIRYFLKMEKYELPFQKIKRSLLIFRRLPCKPLN